MVFLRYLFGGWIFEFGLENSIEFTNRFTNIKYKLILEDNNHPIIQVVSK